MHWQDLVLASATVAFIVALLPTVLSRTEKPALPTSILTTAILVIVTVAYVTLALWVTAVVTSIETFLWATLAVQTLRIRSRSAAASKTETI